MTLHANRIRLLVPGVGLALLVGNLQATDGYFRDLEATSADGQFRVEATSPDNAEGPPRKPFQSRFRYRLLELNGEDELWSRRQPMEPDSGSPPEGPPVALYVSDDGWVVIQTAELGGKPGELVALDRTGHVKLRVDILKTLLPDRKEFIEHVQLSTAGYLWGQRCCHPYFITLRGRPHFCIATWWGRRLLIELAGGRVVTDASEFESELVEAETVFAMSTLKATALWQYDLERTINPGLAKDSSGPGVWEVMAAMLMSANLRLQQAVPLLRELESSPVVLTTSGATSVYAATPGGIKPSSHQNLTVRQAAQLCLRRLGLRPGGYQSTRLLRGDTYWQPTDPLPFQRESRVPELKPGMTPEMVVELIGTPDFISSASVWEYDLDGEMASTLVIQWGKGGVADFEKIAPPKWRAGVTRDRKLVY